MTSGIGKVTETMQADQLLHGGFMGRGGSESPASDPAVGNGDGIGVDLSVPEEAHMTPPAGETVGGKPPKKNPYEGNSKYHSSFDAPHTTGGPPQPVVNQSPSEDFIKNDRASKSMEIQREAQVGQGSGISDSAATSRIAALHPGATPAENSALPGVGPIVPDRAGEKIPGR